MCLQHGAKDLAKALAVVSDAGLDCRHQREQRLAWSTAYLGEPARAKRYAAARITRARRLGKSGDRASIRSLSLRSISRLMRTDCACCDL